MLKGLLNVMGTCHFSDVPSGLAPKPSQQTADSEFIKLALSVTMGISMQMKNNPEMLLN